MGIDLMASRRRIILNSPHLATPTPANPVSFSATLAAPLKGLACAFSPVQAGSGDPAPDNVRPIIGWTGANIYIQDEYDPTAEPTLAVAFPATKNLIDDSIKTVSASNLIIGATSINTFPFHFKPGTYRMTVFGIPNCYGYIRGQNDSELTVAISNSTTGTFTLSVEQDYRIWLYGNNAISGNVTGVMVTAGTDAVSTYEPYGTIYGGYIDPVRGVARAEWRAVDLGSLSWDIFQSTQSGLSFFYSALSDGAANVTGGREAYCASYKRYDPNGGNWWMSTPDKQFISQASGVSSTQRVWIRDDTYTDKDSFKTAVSGVMLVYQLATPIEYPLTPAQLKTLKGANVIYTSLNGDVTPIYWTN